MDDYPEPPPHNGEPPDDGDDYADEPPDEPEENGPNGGEPLTEGRGEEGGKDRKPTAKRARSRRKKVGESERKMASGKPVDERYVYFTATRLTPHSINLPDGRRVRCKGQKASMDGHYDMRGLKEVAEDWISTYYGDGTIQVRVQDVEDNKKLVRNWTLQIDGDINIEQIMEDLEKKPACGMAVLSGYGTASSPAIGHATSMLPEMNDVDKAKMEARKIEAEADIEDARIKREEARREAQRRRRRIEEEEEREREALELKEESRKLGIPLKVLERMKAQQETGMGGPDYHFGPGGRENAPPMDEMGGPMTRAEYYQEREADHLRAEIAELKNEIRGQANQPKTDMAALITAIGTAVAPLVNAQQERAAREAEAAKEDRREVFKIMAEGNKSADKMMATFLDFMKVSTDQGKLSDDRILRLLEFGQNLGGDKGSWIADIGTAVGEIGGGLVAALQGRRGPVPQQVPPPHPGAVSRPQPGGVSGVPGQGHALPPGHPQHALPQGRPPQPAPPPPAPPPPNVATMPGPVPGGVSSGSSSAYATEEDVRPMSPEEEMQGAVTEVVRSMLKQSQSRPQNAEWVEIAQGFLPEVAIREIMQAKDEQVLIEYFKPYVPMKLGAQFFMAMQADPGIKVWLRAGLVELKEMIADTQMSGTVVHAEEPPEEEEYEPREGDDDEPVDEDSVLEGGRQ